MFRCAITRKVTRPGEPMTRVVTRTRDVAYENFNSDGEKVVSFGTEIVEEIPVSPEGLKMIERAVKGEEEKA